MHELTNIASKYKDTTDKFPGTSYHIKHSYTEFYGPLFYPIKDKELNVLEIGVRWGGSILMWRDYFKNSQIYGVDNDWRSLKVDLKVPNVHTISQNAYKEPLLQYFRDNNLMFDVIIEDGNHKPEGQLIVLNTYREFLNPRGIICVEDVHSDHNADLIFEGFEGDKNRLSLVDRTRCETAHFDERVILYNHL